ncbi:MAG: NAD(P)-dependent oxidoreductase [Methanobrevibacter sp.]|uniref:NAD(P)-dependent oxidoreductase n=1 Tax=Methanobrevibacter millerae TaxID=230361 RepID=A0A8T3VJU7_9EURY|nr:NAD(P)-dependent oxidoreductase [Methanobrevibacter millerae]MBE6504930.1 NAD(P)-dependent oxidoreductase [Methanobrevibacter millerae]MBR0057819.1 NAD(P)-dependent oxidoreductase [Methanobrevibacter sp.]
MNITLIGFGKVSYNLFKLIDSPDINFRTSAEGRSQKTIDLINESNIEVYDSFREAVEKSDIVISAVTPSQALDVSRRYARDYKGLYIDLNNVSPDTKNQINELCENFVDGAVIGKIDSNNPTLFLSGKNADKLLFLNDFLKVKIISDKVGDASKLKLLRSTYTKALSVLLMESYALAQKLNLEDEFFDTLSLTEGDEFKDKSLSRINNTLNSSKRKAEELEEILNYFNDDDLKMIKTALLKLKQF